MLFYYKNLLQRGSPSSPACYLLHAICKHEIFREIYNDITEGRVIFQCSLHLCQHSTPAFEQEHAFSHHNSCSPFPTPLQSFMQGSMQCFVIGIVESSHASFYQRTKQVKIWCYKVSTVGWRWLEQSRLHSWRWERCYSCELAAYGDNSKLQLLYWNTKNSECLPSLSSSHKKSVWSVVPPWCCGCTQVWAPRQPSQILDGQCCHIHCADMRSHHQIFTCWFLLSLGGEGG